MGRYHASRYSIRVSKSTRRATGEGGEQLRRVEERKKRFVINVPLDGLLSPVEGWRNVRKTQRRLRCAARFISSWKNTTLDHVSNTRRGYSDNGIYLPRVSR